jgi:hypothetical protein
MMGKKAEEHSFSIEMRSERCVRRMSFLDKENGHVFFEGFLGKLKKIAVVEDVMLEIEGKNGVLKLDITGQELEKGLTSDKKANKEVNKGE